MAKEFTIVHEAEIDGTPQQVFDAATQGCSGWLCREAGRVCGYPGAGRVGVQDAFEAVKAALGIHDGGAGGHISVTIAGVGTVEAVVDCPDESFVGLRTANAMYRFFGPNAFGAVVGMTVNLFNADSGANAGDAGTEAGAAWLYALYA